jgi:hypothetical protein
MLLTLHFRPSAWSLDSDLLVTENTCENYALTSSRERKLQAFLRPNW